MDASGLPLHPDAVTKYTPTANAITAVINSVGTNRLSDMRPRAARSRAATRDALRGVVRQELITE